MDDVTFGHNGRDAKTIGSTTAGKRRGDTGTALEGVGDTGAESDVNECLFLTE